METAQEIEKAIDNILNESIPFELEDYFKNLHNLLCTLLKLPSDILYSPNVQDQSSRLVFRLGMFSEQLLTPDSLEKLFQEVLELAEKVKTGCSRKSNLNLLVWLALATNQTERAVQLYSHASSIQCTGYPPISAFIQHSLDSLVLAMFNRRRVKLYWTSEVHHSSEVLSKLLEEVELSTNITERNIIRTLAFLGLASEYRYQSSFEKAFNAIKIALQAADKVNWPLLKLKILLEEGLIYKDIGSETALEKWNEAISIAQNIKALREWLKASNLIARFNISKRTLNSENLKIPPLDISIQEELALKIEDYRSLVWAYVIAAEAASTAKNHELALTYLKKTLDFHQYITSRDHAFVLSMLAAEYMVTGKSEDALQVLEESTEFHTLFSDQTLSKIWRVINVALKNTINGNYEEANRALESLTTVMDKLGYNPAEGRVFQIFFSAMAQTKELKQKATEVLEISLPKGNMGETVEYMGMIVGCNNVSTNIYTSCSECPLQGNCDHKKGDFQ